MRSTQTLPNLILSTLSLALFWSAFTPSHGLGQTRPTYSCERLADDVLNDWYGRQVNHRKTLSRLLNNQVLSKLSDYEKGEEQQEAHQEALISALVQSLKQTIQEHNRVMNCQVNFSHKELRALFSAPDSPNPSYTGTYVKTSALFASSSAMSLSATVAYGVLTTGFWGTMFAGGSSAAVASSWVTEPVTISAIAVGASLGAGGYYYWSRKAKRKALARYKRRVRLELLEIKHALGQRLRELYKRSDM